MEDDVKICPECEAEYFPHIVNCAGCGVKLISPSEHRAMSEALPAADASLVCIEEGGADVLGDLARGLKAAGIDSKILRAAPASGCSSKTGLGLFVHENATPAAMRLMPELWRKIFPEIKEAEEKMQGGLCPACGAYVGDSYGSCPECGLSIGWGSGGAGGHGGCDSGCGPHC